MNIKITTGINFPVIFFIPYLTITLESLNNVMKINIYKPVSGGN
jgi:hypothetical protein